MKKILTAIAVAATAMLPAEVFAQESAALPFMNIMAGPRTAAMGGISAGLAPGAYAHFDNVAAVPFNEETFAAGVSYGMWQPDAAKSHLVTVGGIYRINDRLGVTFGTLVGVNSSYELMDDNGSITGSFTPKDFRIGAGVSYRVIDDLSVGVALNYAQSTLAPKSDLYSTTMKTFAADIQVMYRISDFDISLSANNLGTPVKSASGESFSIPMNAKLAAGYENDFDDVHHLSAGIEGGLYFGGPSAAFAAAGAEYMYNDIVAVRAGYHYGGKANGIASYASVGLGVKFCGVNIDAAYLVAGKDSPMKNTFSVGVGYSF